MGFLDRAIRKGVGDAVNKAIGGAVKDAVTPVAERYANRAAERLDRAAETTSREFDRSASAMQDAMQQPRNAQQPRTAQPYAAGSGFANLEGALGNFTRTMETYATEAAKNTKVCPSCGEVTTADKRFCPSCGAKLPEQTLAQGAVCTQCGTQNALGTRFCQACGAKLPSAVAEERARADRNAAVFADWARLLPEYPQWSCGGNSFTIEHSTEYGYTEFIAVFSDEYAAPRAVEQYKALLRQCGFREAGQYADRDHLYKMVNGVCCHVNTEHCFDGGRERASLYFNHEEPTGGFYYVKPQPQRKTSLLDRFL